MPEANRFLPDTWAEQLQDIDLEIARQASICQVSLLQPGVIERVLTNDMSVCGAEHPQSFHTLRGLLYIHFTEITRMSRALSPQETRDIADKVRAHLEAILRPATNTAREMPAKDA